MSASGRWPGSGMPRKASIGFAAPNGCRSRVDLVRKERLTLAAAVARLHSSPAIRSILIRPANFRLIIGSCRRPSGVTWTNPMLLIWSSGKIPDRQSNSEVLTTTRFPFEIAEACMMVLSGAALRFELQVLQRLVRRGAYTSAGELLAKKGSGEGLLCRWPGRLLLLTLLLMPSGVLAQDLGAQTPNAAKPPPAFTVTGTPPSLVSPDIEEARERLQLYPGAVSVVGSDDYTKGRGAYLEDFLRYTP